MSAKKSHESPEVIRETLSSTVNDGAIYDYRRRFDAGSDAGFVVGASFDLAFICGFVDFRYDAYRIVQIADIEALRTKKNGDRYRDILIEDDLAHEAGEVPAVDLASIRNAIRSVWNGSTPLIIDIESELDRDEDELYIGFASHLDEDRFLMQHFGTDGEWDQEPWEIERDDVTQVQMRSFYASVWGRHISPCPGIDPDVRAGILNAQRG